MLIISNLKSKKAEGIFYFFLMNLTNPTKNIKQKLRWLRKLLQKI